MSEVRRLVFWPGRLRSLCGRELACPREKSQNGSPAWASSSLLAPAGRGERKNQTRPHKQT
uniref:Uncharacterized protein n=1 Tax=Arundo donax TaxID=35708 RepID=A0A0A8YTA1_ARUDO